MGTATLFKRAAAAVVLLSCGVASAQTRVNGAGATFPEPLYKRWIGEYGRVNRGARIDYQGIGSGGGIKGITDRTLDYAGSDAPMSKKELANAGGESNIVEIPSCAGGVVPAYNLPGINQELKFTGEILADIYMGKIQNWNDARIAAVNPGVQLPGTAITPAWRTDGSGTTFVFTNYLATQSAEFKEAVGTGKQVDWPAGQGGKGNPGVAAIVQQTPGAIGYIEQNFADQNNIAYGAVKNAADKFVKSSSKAVSAAGEGAVDKINGALLAADIWNQAGEGAYPIASFTYLIVYKDLNNLKSKAQAQALVEYLWWATHEGQQYATEMGYAPLAPGVQKKVEAALATLSFKGNPLQIATTGSSR